MKNVEYSLETLPPLTDAQSREIRRLSARPNCEPDTSDIPELSDAQFADAKRGMFYRLWNMGERPCAPLSTSTRMY